MIFLIRNWKYALILSGTLAALIFFGLWRIEVGHNKLQKAQIAKMDEQIEIAALEINQCSKDKTLIEGVANGYQNDLVIVRRERDRLRNSPACILPEPSGTAGIHSGSGSQLSSGNGIRTDWLYDLAERADQDRITGKWCLEFVDQLYKSRSYNE